MKRLNGFSFPTHRIIYRITLRRICFSVLASIIFILSLHKIRYSITSEANLPTIIVITPTYPRPERLADMTRLSQTLMHIKDLQWIVVEDGNQTVDAVDRLLKRSGLPYAYLHEVSEANIPKKGWSHRNAALSYIRRQFESYGKPGVVYFADDDNSYDLRLFNNYIRNVTTIGFWAVGLGGGAKVEAPDVVNGTIVKWNVVFAPTRKFATDMCGFAINLKLILDTNASFHRGCMKRRTPETCFLEQFGLSLAEVQAFGWNDNPKDILVWHTKTTNQGTRGETYGYVVDIY